MNIDWALIDAFQQRFGEQPAFERSRDFMFAYVSQVQKPLPPIAAETMKTARAFRAGTATLKERKKVIADTWKYISDHSAWGDSTTPEYCIMRALTGLLHDRLGENERLSEEIGWFVFYVNRFEDHSYTAKALIERFFGAEPNNAQPVSKPSA